MNYSIYNPDNAELLVRFMTELEKAGYTDDENGMWNKHINPFTEFPKYSNKLRAVYVAWILIFNPKKIAIYSGHKGAFADKQFNLTEENFDEVLKEVLQ